MLVDLSQLLTKILDRWSRQQESAVWQAVDPNKTLGRRFAAFAKSERVEAKFLLLAAAPLLPIAFSDELGWTRGTFWQIWFWLSIAWLICIVIWSLIAYTRVLRRWRGRKP